MKMVSFRKTRLSDPLSNIFRPAGQHVEDIGLPSPSDVIKTFFQDQDLNFKTKTRL